MLCKMLYAFTLHTKIISFLILLRNFLPVHSSISLCIHEMAQELANRSEVGELYEKFVAISIFIQVERV